MKTLCLILIFQFLFSFGLFSQEYIFYGKEKFTINGTSFSEAEKENSYNRLRTKDKSSVRAELWALSKNSSGISVGFETNSSIIKVRWKLSTGFRMSHMAKTGIGGVDLYCKVDTFWQYVNTGKPEKLENIQTLVEGMTKEKRVFILNLPLYDGVEILEIGIDKEAEIKPYKAFEGKPIVFYGTSITQGGCASRPGMAYTNIISRKTGKECINFGFSGNGRMEPELAEIISEIDAEFFVIDCIANMKAPQVKENTEKLIRIIRQKHPKTPIIFIESLIYENGFFNSSRKENIDEKNRILYEEVRRVASLNGDSLIFYIDNKEFLGNDHEATVDGTHFTDLGFMRFSEFLIKKFKEFGLLGFT
ncbi:MAG: SGNH/GDSL hydrolase family protein [Bacteroidales bacterium]|nr:SGNH/GDSL hydrolase family protein [Bacteroidales bacterium]